MEISPKKLLFPTQCSPASFDYLSFNRKVMVRSRIFELCLSKKVRKSVGAKIFPCILKKTPNSLDFLAKSGMILKEEEGFFAASGDAAFLLAAFRGRF